MRSSFQFLLIAVLICSLSGSVNVAQSGETLVRPPAFDWDNWTPPKYVPNWK